MRSFVEASLVVFFSLVVTVLILAVIIPRHPLVDGNLAVEPPAMSPAVFVEGTHERPGRTGNGLHPRITQEQQTVLCPYLIALAAASACPAAPERPSESPCPFLRELRRQEVDAQSESVTSPGKDI